ncbi:hypothetical protein MHU86_8730 [Fragilaria crotonensis]|nr:hypothetical protein MHU86_19399 [Fragilaria crotonensis]KAI2505671.1 hypothetical protein MHU86_8730 [Fragilaria crotonensis]
MSTTILTFVDFFKEGYSESYLITVSMFAVQAYLLCLIGGIIHKKPLMFLAGIDIFFDITSGAANWQVGTTINRTHAVGSALHSIAASLMRWTDTKEWVDTLFVDKGTNIAWVAELLEMAAIVATLSGWQLILAAIILSVGASVVFIRYCAVINEGESFGDAYVQRTRAAVVIVSLGYQVISLLIVLIAAIGHPERLLWILPEIPFETIMIVRIYLQGR